MYGIAFSISYFRLVISVVIFGLMTQVAMVNSTQDCSTAGISCSGYDVQGCSQFCSSYGYSYSQCEGSCCLCYQATDSPSRHRYAAFKKDSFSWKDPFIWGNIIDHGESGKKSKPSPKPQSNQIYQMKKKTNKVEYKDESIGDICNSVVCSHSAQALKSNMNENVDPCVDFYSFACGGFVQKTEIPSDEARVDVFTIVDRKVTKQVKGLLEEESSSNRREIGPFRLAKALYRSCMNNDIIEKRGLKPIKEILKRLGGWPVLEGSNWNSTGFNWMDMIVQFRKMGLLDDMLMNVQVEPFILNAAFRFIHINAPEFALTRDILIRGANEPAVDAYHKYQIKVAQFLGASPSEAEEDMRKALELEVKLAQHFVREEEQRQPMTVAQLHFRYPYINWMKFLQGMLPSKVQMTMSDTVIMSIPNYLVKMFHELSASEPRVVANYLLWRVTVANMRYLDKAARDLRAGFHGALTGQLTQQPQWLDCVKIVSNNFEHAVGAMYIRRFFKKGSRAVAQEMVDDIGIAFMDHLDEASWMDQTTRQKAKDKAWAMESHIGYPMEHLDDVVLTKYHEGMAVMENNFFGNMQNLLFLRRNAKFLELRHAVNRTSWKSHGQNADVNAFYAPQENSIRFPAGILQDQFFDADRPRYMNYGSIGWIIGHEITHGFDNVGHLFDKFGNLADWWAPSTKQTYQRKTDCLLNQYSQFEATEVGMKVNAKKSNGENIADNGGIKQAYRGYQSWIKRNGQEKKLPGLPYTPNQLFWISAANNWCSKFRPEILRHFILTQSHLPGQFRVLGTFANSKEFANDFQCPAGTPMNPVNKCLVW